MRGRIMFVAGAAVGYVLGSRAGRRRYEQIKAGAERVWNTAPVQKAVDQAEGFVKDRAQAVPGAVVNGAKRVAAQVRKPSDDESTTPSI